MQWFPVVPVRHTMVPCHACQAYNGPMLCLSGMQQSPAMCACGVRMVVILWFACVFHILVTSQWDVHYTGSMGDLWLASFINCPYHKLVMTGMWSDVQQPEEMTSWDQFVMMGRVIDMTDCCHCWQAHGDGAITRRLLASVLPVNLATF